MKTANLAWVFICCLLLLAGCVSIPQRRTIARVSAADYIDLETFCKKFHFQYSFDTLDDMIKLYTSGEEIKILLNSFVGTFQGSFFYLKNAPVCYRGKIFIPRQLEQIIFSKDFTTFKPLFNINTIVVDPGHGGKDPGAISTSGFQEKIVNLLVTKYLKQKLEEQGFKVILTRTDDIYLTLKERIDVAKKHNADLFISIHANSNHSSAVSGAEIYYLSLSHLNSYERSIKLAKTEDFGGKDIPFDVKAILWDLLITKNYSSSVELSNLLHFTFKNLGFRIKPPKEAPFYVLRFAYVPSVLVEMGYLSNHYEEKALRKKHYQKQVAEAIALAVASLNERYSSLAEHTVGR